MDLLHLEQQRLALEANLQKLRLSLKHWQTWEAEYEGLKEEIQGSGDNPSTEDLEKIVMSYDGELVNEKEIRELFDLRTGSPRSAQQVLRLIQRRQEYVQKNIETVQRQFFEAEAKSEELAFAARSQSESSQAGLPLTEIHEELDDNDNIISSHLSQPEQSTADLVASLRKAGLKESDMDPDLPVKPKPEELKPAITNASPLISPTTSRFEKRENSDTPRSRTSSSGAEDLERPSMRKKSVSFTADTKPAEERQRLPSEDGRKSVSFADKVAVMPAAPPADTRSVSFSPMIEEIPPQPLGPASPEMQATANNEALSGSNMTTSSSDVSKAGGLRDLALPEEVILPEDESPEDARIRRELLEYHLNEVGNVVAQIDLDDPDMEIDDDEEEEDDNSSYFTSSEYLDDEDTPYTTGLSDSEESEDEFGRTKRRMVSPRYHEQMEELERRLIGNLGPEPKNEDIEDVDAELNPQDVRRLVIREKRNSASSASSDNSEKKSAGKKRVSFAESLAVAEAAPPSKAQKLEEGENSAPITTDVIERSTAASHSLPQGFSTDRQSRFKKDRAAPITDLIDADSTMTGSAVDEVGVGGRPTGPPGVPIASTLTERVPTSKTAIAPSLDEPDAELERRTLATEYHRQRNDMIKQQGGFNSNANDDDDLGELMEERDGRVKKVSRFKAARIKPQ